MSEEADFKYCSSSVCKEGVLWLNFVSHSCPYSPHFSFTGGACLLVYSVLWCVALGPRCVGKKLLWEGLCPGGEGLGLQHWREKEVEGAPPLCLPSLPPPSLSLSLSLSHSLTHSHTHTQNWMYPRKEHTSEFRGINTHRCITQNIKWYSVQFGWGDVYSWLF